MKATDIKEIEAMTGAKVVAATKENSSFNSDFVLLDDNGTIRQAFTVRDINGKMCADVFAAEYDSIGAALAYLNMSDEELAQNIEYINPENNTPSTMNANETKAPEFSELTHTATNIVLTAENNGDIYRRYVAPLVLSLANKIKQGITPNRKRLAQSSAMRSIIAASLAEMYVGGWMEGNTKVTAAERKEAANYLAWSYISDAEDEYNNQMKAYK
jgi:hypothetical protein